MGNKLFIIYLYTGTYRLSPPPSSPPAPTTFFGSKKRIKNTCSISPEISKKTVSARRAENRLKKTPAASKMAKKEEGTCTFSDFSARVLKSQLGFTEFGSDSWKSARIFENRLELLKIGSHSQKLFLFYSLVPVIAFLTSRDWYYTTCVRECCCCWLKFQGFHLMCGRWYTRDERKLSYFSDIWEIFRSQKLTPGGANRLCPPHIGSRYKIQALFSGF